MVSQACATINTKSATNQTSMSAESYRFKVGTFECMAVSDGTSAYQDPVSTLFINAPKKRLEQKLREHNLQPEQWKEWISPYICALIKTEEHLVLVDTGQGSLETTTGRLIQNLRTEDIGPDDIDTIILTHGHPDHIGGNLTSEGKPAFPKARFVMWKDEWDFWISDRSVTELKIEENLKKMLIDLARNNLLPVKSQLDLIEHGTEIVPGIKAVMATGHTPGHIAVAISSRGEQLLCVSDAVLHPIHLESPDWYSPFDVAPEQTVITRRRLFNRAATEKTLVLAFHFPFPGLGHITKKGDGWQWQPI